MLSETYSAPTDQQEKQDGPEYFQVIPPVRHTTMKPLDYFIPALVVGLPTNETQQQKFDNSSKKTDEESIRKSDYGSFSLPKGHNVSHKDLGSRNKMGLLWDEKLFINDKESEGLVNGNRGSLFLWDDELER